MRPLKKCIRAPIRAFFAGFGFSANRLYYFAYVRFAEIRTGFEIIEFAQRSHFINGLKIKTPGGCMSEAMKKLGERFRSKREEMNLTLKEVENATSIRMTYLQAIEEGRIVHFLSSVYALGFIRQYANFLGFEQEKLTKEFPDALRMPTEKQDFAYGIGTLEMRSSPQGGVRWVPNLIWGSAFVLLAICAWYFAKFMGII